MSARPASGFTTRSIHAAGGPEVGTGAVVQPLYLTSTFAMDEPGKTRAGYDYQRSGNPNRTALEDTLAALEGAEWAAAVTSGMAAETAVLSALLSAGDTVVIPHEVYGGTARLLDDIFARWDITTLAVDLNDRTAVEAALEKKPALVWVETPSNPGLDVHDIAWFAEATHAAGGLLVVDNTFGTPYLQQPLSLGADISLHSTTKFINGHSDSVGGAILVKDQGAVPQSADLVSRLEVWLESAGVGQSPFDAWLTLRGLKTLAVRMDRHCANAEVVAQWLVTRPEVEKVFFPGLESHPDHELAKTQMAGFGGMVTFEAKTEEIALKVSNNVEVFTLAESLGGVESLLDHAATMTHLSVAGTDQAIEPTIIRLSIGLEEPEDLIKDLERAFEA